ncbi:MAG: tRNA (adenosine(37)-N6)-dimethylallyltransferase MiaA, partial [Pseudomonadota bacterium]
MKPDAILLAGPTASGKSAKALQLAEQHDGVIVNTDSMQVYPVLDVLTARPSPEDFARVQHMLYGHAPLDQPYSVARWLDDANAAAQAVWAQGKIPIFVGGTGLYFRALDHGLANTPEIDPDLRRSVRDDLIEHGSGALYLRLQEHDPTGAEGLRPTDGQRIARALEVVLQTGKSLAHFQANAASSALLGGRRVERLVLMPERSELHARINKRARIMLENGALEEVKALLALDLPPEATVLRAIGVPQLTSLLAGELSQSDALEALRAATRQYAKRQFTWFRGQLDDRWKVL